MNNIITIIITSCVFLIFIFGFWNMYKNKQTVFNGAAPVAKQKPVKKCKHRWSLLGAPFDHKVRDQLTGEWRYIICQGYRCTKCGMLHYVRVPSNTALEKLEGEKYGQ